MAVNDEIREQRQKLKGKGIRAKAEYFWEYYKWHTIAVLVTAIFLSILIKDVIANKQQPYLYGLFVNASATFDTDAVIPDLASYTEVKTSKHPIILESNLTYNKELSDTTIDMYTPPKIMALSESGDVDFMVCDLDAMEYYAGPAYFEDIRNVLTDEQISKYEDDFYYYEYDDLGSIPVGIKITDAPLFSKTTAYEGDVYFAVFYTSERKQNAISFLNFSYSDAVTEEATSN